MPEKKSGFGEFVCKLPRNHNGFPHHQPFFDEKPRWWFQICFLFAPKFENFDPILTIIFFADGLSWELNSTTNFWVILMKKCHKDFFFDGKMVSSKICPSSQGGSCGTSGSSSRRRRDRSSFRGAFFGPWKSGRIFFLEGDSFFGKNSMYVVSN